MTISKRTRFGAVDVLEPAAQLGPGVIVRLTEQADFSLPDDLLPIQLFTRTRLLMILPFPRKEYPYR